MLNSLTSSAHNTLPPSQIIRLLTGALLLAAAALTGCSQDSGSHADLSGLLARSHTGLRASDISESSQTFLPSRRHARTRNLSRIDLPTRHSGLHTL